MNIGRLIQKMFMCDVKPLELDDTGHVKTEDRQLAMFQQST